MPSSDACVTFELVGSSLGLWSFVRGLFLSVSNPIMPRLKLARTGLSVAACILGDKAAVVWSRLPPFTASRSTHSAGYQPVIRPIQAA